MTTLPLTIELCARLVNGQPCGNRVYRMGPEQAPYCYRCGGTEPGVVYSRVEHPAGAVRRFHEAFGVALGSSSWANEDRRRLRRELIREEFREYRDAEDADDPAATLEALVDLTYVIVGAALEYGWDFAGAFAAVHAANMAKLGPDGKPILREDGKVLKPEGWQPADLTPFLSRGAPPAIAALARRVLRDYQLNAEERADETRRLTEQISVAVEAHLEGLEHRKV